MPTTMTGKELFEWLTSEGLSPAGATGIVANLQAESGLNAKANQPNGPGRGIAQWSEGGRWDQLVAAAKNARRDPEDINTQLWFMKREMQSSGLWERLKKVKDEREATRIVLKEYEKPKDQTEAEVTRRLNLGKGVSTGAKDLSGSVLDRMKDTLTPEWLPGVQNFFISSGKVVGLSLLGALLVILGIVILVSSSKAATTVAKKVSPIS